MSQSTEAMKTITDSPTVDPKPKDSVGVIDAQQLEPEPTERVARDVQSDRAATDDSVSTLDPDEQPGDGDPEPIASRAATVPGTGCRSMG